ncbi:hypothetical protein [Chryseobacterium sp. KCF3-3]|uniref:hypothetical protein n=1 Tax=Chryseobacterium sp. KCF3-3 TaxID=3231511 RepID=UPI0038B3841E
MEKVNIKNAPDIAPYVSSKEVDKLGKALSAQLYVPAYIMSGGTGSAIGDYLIAAGQRGLTDLSTQTYFKGGIKNVDGRQLLINTEMEVKAFRSQVRLH